MTLHPLSCIFIYYEKSIYFSYTQVRVLVAILVTGPKLTACGDECSSSGAIRWDTWDAVGVDVVKSLTLEQ
ncbi:hypothetical protein [Nitrosomonas sp. Is37]|uniref:hypothetical protein n=1 Tax=Nitrosomonas sp. Is37 TaxID=3080535 RepID=UPI00294B464C|nr:hypothetical protein [Nitrosomonas sp. Is37]MDV6344893.1 hypothetical protein [Nitrosomonas sp. Is37]